MLEEVAVNLLVDLADDLAGIDRQGNLGPHARGHRQHSPENEKRRYKPAHEPSPLSTG